MLSKAESLALRALALQPRNGHYLDTYGWILHKKGENHKAVSVLSQAFELKPNEPEILEHLADVFLVLGNKERAVQLYQLASELFKGENLTRVGRKIAQIQKPSRTLGSTPCLLYTSPSPRDQRGSRMPSSA